jgi:hypothetical protein
MQLDPDLRSLTLLPRLKSLNQANPAAFPASEQADRLDLGHGGLLCLMRDNTKLGWNRLPFFFTTSPRNSRMNLNSPI